LRHFEKNKLDQLARLAVEPLHQSFKVGIREGQDAFSLQ
jgi:hypothetical protein